MLFSTLYHCYCCKLKSFDTYKAVLPLNIMRARHYVCVVSSQTFLLLLSLNAYCVTLTPLLQILRHVTAWDLLLNHCLVSQTHVDSSLWFIRSSGKPLMYVQSGQFCGYAGISHRWWFLRIRYRAGWFLGSTRTCTGSRSWGTECTITMSCSDFKCSFLLPLFNSLTNTCLCGWRYTLSEMCSTKALDWHFIGKIILGISLIRHGILNYKLIFVSLLALGKLGPSK